MREGLTALYADFPRLPRDSFIEFDVSIESLRSVRTFKRSAAFLLDGHDTFPPGPAEHAFATLEWGMNWCVSVHCNEFLKLHAGVVSTGDRAIVMPGVPGAGKSTLCALLGLSGWRVLSDEHALIRPGTAAVTPLYRPVSLKNASIETVRSRFPDCTLGPVADDTHKGTVAHLKADKHPATFTTAPVPVVALVFPEYSTQKPQRLVPAEKSHSFLAAAFHSFNYSLLGEQGFHAMRVLIERTPCFNMTYHDVDWALEAFDVILEQSESQA